MPTPFFMLPLGLKTSREPWVAPWSVLFGRSGPGGRECCAANFDYFLYLLLNFQNLVAIV